MKDSEVIKVIRPFSPSIARVKIPNELVENLNSYVDKIIIDEKQIKKLDHGKTLEGSVTQELRLENDFIVRNLLFKNFEKNINLNEAGIFFTVLSLYFFYNFLNFSDGANVITVSLCIFWTLIFIFFGNLNQLFLIIILIWLLFVLIFNLSEKLFIGNSGSSFLSILFGSLFILNYNFDYSIKCDEILLLMFIPAVDSIRVIIERIFKGYSPFKPDKTHLHHFMFTSFNAKVVFIPYILFASLPYISNLYVNNS